MKRGVVSLTFDNLAYLQSFDEVKVCYGDGQYAVTRSLHDAIGYAAKEQTRADEGVLRGVRQLQEELPEKDQGDADLAGIRAPS